MNQISVKGTWGFAPNPTSFFFLIRKTKQKESRKIDPIFPYGLPTPGDFSGQRTLVHASHLLGVNDIISAFDFFRSFFHRNNTE